MVRPRDQSLTGRVEATRHHEAAHKQKNKAETDDLQNDSRRNRIWKQVWLESKKIFIKEGGTLHDHLIQKD